jgi:HK97 gp10 family phage protein
VSSWRGYSSYGKSALGVSIGINGLDEYLKKIEAAGNDIDETCKDAVNAALPIVEKPMIEGAKRHERSGDVVKAIETTPAKQEGNYIYGTVGIDIAKHPEAIHAVFQEYGDGHSPEFPDPFIRPAFDEHKSEIKKAERDVLKKAGVPVE